MVICATQAHDVDHSENTDSHDLSEVDFALSTPISNDDDNEEVVAGESL